MAIDIQKIVTTDFRVVKADSPISSYGNTVVLTYGSGEDTISTTYTSYEQAITDAYFSQNKYDAYIYYTLGGRKLTHINVATVSEDTNVIDTIFNKLVEYKKSVANTVNDFICVSVSDSELSTYVQGLLTKIDALKAPNKMLLLKSTTTTESLLSNNNLIYKYYKCEEELDTCDAALTIAAYLSKINLTNASSLRDYCYTDESSVIDLSDDLYGKTMIAVNMSSSDYDSYKDNLNFIDLIGDNLVNFGGNTSSKTSIIAEFGAICVENAIIYSVLQTMLQKQYLTNTGLNNVVTRIHTVLQDYINNGFLETNTTYTGSTRYYNYGDRTYTVVSTGEELVNGYKILSIPMSRLTLDDRANKKFTPIYVYMQTLGGARTVEITGEILD